MISVWIISIILCDILVLCFMVSVLVCRYVYISVVYGIVCGL